LPDPLDLLYGSKKKNLANVIYQDMSQWNLGNAERLAAGWTTYLYARWFHAPSQESWDHIPEFLRPLPEQYSIAHPACMDGFPIPAIRRNIILTQGQHSFPEIVGLFGCCLRVRWPWKERILVPGDDNVLRVRPEFLQTFMSRDGWALNDDFLKTYPDLVEGLDPDAIRHQIL
jgi:hypothetical protein